MLLPLSALLGRAGAELEMSSVAASFTFIIEIASPPPFGGLQEVSRAALCSLTRATPLRQGESEGGAGGRGAEGGFEHRIMQGRRRGVRFKDILFLFLSVDEYVAFASNRKYDKYK